MTTVEYLRETKAIIAAPEKWIQKSFQGPVSNSYCIIGAIHHIAALKYNCLTEFEIMFRSTTKVTNVLYAAINNHNLKERDFAYKEETIILWNDAPERTHAEVMAAFDRAILLAEKEEQSNANIVTPTE